MNAEATGRDLSLLRGVLATKQSRKTGSPRAFGARDDDGFLTVARDDSNATRSAILASSECEKY
jgi:hypothetical protein